MSGTNFFKHVYSASLNKIRNIFWGQKILRSTFHMPKFVKTFNKIRHLDASGVNRFYIAFPTYLNIIRSKLVGQTELRSKFLYFRIHEIF